MSNDNYISKESFDNFQYHDSKAFMLRAYNRGKHFRLLSPITHCPQTPTTVRITRPLLLAWKVMEVRFANSFPYLFCSGDDSHNDMANHNSMGDHNNMENHNSMEDHNSMDNHDGKK